MKSTIKNTVSEVYQLNDNGELSEKTKNILGMNFNSNNNSNTNNSKNKNNSNKKKIKIILTKIILIILKIF